jgi:hypothetical protein
MSFLDPLLGAEVTQLGAIGLAPRYVLRWHKQTSWRRRGTELGAINLGAELRSVQKTCLAQLVNTRLLALWSWVRASRWVFFNTFCLCHLFLFLLFIFLVYVANLSVLIYFSSSFIFVTDLFIRPDFFIPRAQQLCATVLTSHQLLPLFAQLTTIKIK